MRDVPDTDGGVVVRVEQTNLVPVGVDLELRRVLVALQNDCVRERANGARLVFPDVVSARNARESRTKSRWSRGGCGRSRGSWSRRRTSPTARPPPRTILSDVASVERVVRRGRGTNRVRGPERSRGRRHRQSRARDHLRRVSHAETGADTHKSGSPARQSGHSRATSSTSWVLRSLGS